MQAIRPLRDRVIVKRVEADEKSAGGIYIPKTADPNREQAWQAVVTAVGPGRLLDNKTLVACGVKLGERVLVGRYAGNEILVDGDKYVSLHDDDILGVVEEC